MPALPKTIGTVADHLFALRAKRLLLEEKVKELKRTESELKEHGVKLLSAQRITSGRGTTATFSFKPTAVPNVEDWAALYEYVGENDAFDLLQRRVATKAWAERVEEDGKSIPGVKSETINKVSLTKVGR